MSGGRRLLLHGRAFAAIALALGVGGASVGAGDAGRAAQVPTFSAQVESVRVDVSVRRDGRAVRGLTAADFEVFDNGVRQEITFSSLEDLPVNVVLALDMSGSVQGARLAELAAAVKGLVTRLRPADTAALVAFTELVTVRTEATADRRRVLSALEVPAAGTDTALLDAAHTSMVLADTESGRPLVIIFSDGADTASFLSPALVLDTARRTGPVVYAVTSTEAARGDFLDQLVGLTGGRRLEVASLDRLGQTFAAILNESRERYLLSYVPTGVAAGGWHEITVQVRGGRADVRARPGYLAPAS
jgi:Ca-activated chloride channel homolog